jgi:hypothetical protein
MLDIQEDPILYYDSGRLDQLRENEFNQYLMSKDSFHKFQGLNKSNGNLWNINPILSHMEPCI